ncbi:MAG: Hsp70 family protein, partial [Proteobacteria bacterium]|nr:Hsp70 family protein [Pseudomonadota bacterium]
KSDSEDIILSMNLDLNGILTVVATEKKTGLAKRITIDNSFDHEDISESIEKLSDFFGDDANTILHDPVSDGPGTEDDPSLDNKEDNKIYVAKTMIEKAESKIDQALPEDAEEMEKIIERLETEIEAKNLSEVEQLTDELTDILFYID